MVKVVEQLMMLLIGRWLRLWSVQMVLPWWYRWWQNCMKTSLLGLDLLMVGPVTVPLLMTRSHAASAPSVSSSRECSTACTYSAPAAWIGSWKTRKELAMEMLLLLLLWSKAAVIKLTK